MEIKEFTRPVCKIVREDIAMALDEVAKKYGIQFVVTGGTFTPFDFRVRVEGTVKTEARKTQVDDAEKVFFGHYCTSFGLAPEDWGKIITMPSGKKFKITGISLRSVKYPIQITRLPDLKPFKASTHAVQQALKANI